MYSFPNTVLPFFGGIILDKFGMRNGVMAFVLVNTLGQFIMYLGAARHNYNLVLGGRIIFGLGGECTSVA